MEPPVPIGTEADPIVTEPDPIGTLKEPARGVSMGLTVPECGTTAEAAFELLIEFGEPPEYTAILGVVAHVPVIPERKLPTDVGVPGSTVDADTMEDLPISLADPCQLDKIMMIADPL